MPQVKNEKTFAPEVVMKDYMDATQGRTKSPWQYEPLADEIKNSPVEWRIFNVGPFRKDINSGGLGKQIIRPCPDGTPYLKVAEIRKWVIDHADQGEYRMSTILIEGKDRVREMVTPNSDPETDLRKWGIFYTKNETPTEAELKDANDRLNDTCDQIVKYGDFLYEANRRKELTQVFIIAAKHLGASRPWCTASQRMIECPGCSESVHPKARKHVACGYRLDLGCFEGEKPTIKE